MRSESIHILGPGEIGRRLAAGANSMGLATTLVSRAESPAVLANATGTLLLAMREDDLPAALAQIPVANAHNVVLVQNGFIEDVIATHPGHTRAVLWFTCKGDFFADLFPSPVHGPLASLMKSVIEAAGARAVVVDDAQTFARMALEKALWNCVVGAPLAAWKVDFATALRERRRDVEAIVDEGIAVVRAVRGVALDRASVLAQLDATVGAVGWMRGGSKGLAYRNGWIVAQGRARGIATPANAV